MGALVGRAFLPPLLLSRRGFERPTALCGLRRAFLVVRPPLSNRSVLVFTAGFRLFCLFASKTNVFARDVRFFTGSFTVSTDKLSSLSLLQNSFCATPCADSDELLDEE